MKFNACPSDFTKPTVCLAARRPTSRLSVPPRKPGRRVVVEFTAIEEPWLPNPYFVPCMSLAWASCATASAFATVAGLDEGMSRCACPGTVSTGHLVKN